MAFSVSIYEEPFIPRVVNFKTLAKCYILPRAHEIAKIAQEKLGNLWFIEGSNYDVSLAEQLQAQGLEKLGRSTVYRLCDGWLVKIGQSLSFEDSSHDPGPSGGEKVMLGGPHKFNHVFRPLFNEWIGQVMRRQAIQISLPQEFLYPIKTEGKVHSYQKYVVICEEIECENVKDVYEKIQSWSLNKQKVFFEYLCWFIYETGYVDTNLGNIVFSLTPCNIEDEVFNRLAVIDTEPFGMITEMTCAPPLSSLGAFGFATRLSLAQARYLGLKRLLQSCEKLSGEVQAVISGWIKKAEGVLELQDEREEKSEASSIRGSIPRRVTEDVTSVLSQRVGSSCCQRIVDCFRTCFQTICGGGVDSELRAALIKK